MIRLEFVKGQGGVVNLVNGNLRSDDRDAMVNLEDVDRIIVNTTDAIAINNALIAMEISGYIVLFDALSSMQPYLDQIDLVDGELFNPGINGVKKPDWDVAGRDKTEGIQSHTYEDTDIEKDWINGTL